MVLVTKMPSTMIHSIGMKTSLKERDPVMALKWTSSVCVIKTGVAWLVAHKLKFECVIIFYFRGNTDFFMMRWKTTQRSIRQKRKNLSVLHGMHRRLSEKLSKYADIFQKWRDISWKRYIIHQRHERRTGCFPDALPGACCIPRTQIRLPVYEK